MDELWIVDAMNVIGSRPDGWWKDRAGAMRDFALAVDEHARTTGRHVVVVFDTEPGDLADVADIEVVVATRRGRNAADDDIARLVADEPDPSRVRVVTSDADLIERVMAAGAKVVSSGSFRRNVEGDRR